MLIFPYDKFCGRMAIKRSVLVVAYTIFVAWLGLCYPAFSATGETISQAEDALAKKGIIALAAVDLKAALEADKKIFQSDHSSYIINNLITSNVILNSLPKDNIENILAAYSITDKDSDYNIIVYGKFSKEKVIEEISKLHTIRHKSMQNKDIYEVFYEDFQTCVVSEPINIEITDKRIIISPHNIDEILNRFKNSSKPTVNLSNFKKIRKDKILAIAIFKPDNAKKIISEPLLKYLAHNSGNIDNVYIDASLDKKSSKINIEFAVSNTDKNWNQEQINKFKTFKSNMENESIQSGFMALSTIYKSLSIKENPLTIRASLSREDLQIANNFYDDIYNLTVFGYEKDNLPVQKNITPDINGDYKFASETSFEKILSFEKIKNHIIFNAKAMAGPFGITVKNNTQLDRINNIYEVELAFQSSNIPNLNIEPYHIAENGQARLFITEAEDIDEKSILGKETYCKDRNDRPAIMQNFWDIVPIKGESERITRLEGIKKIRLKSGKGLHNTAVIKGYFELDLNTKTSTATIEAPFDGKKIENAGFNMSFHKSGNHEVRYDIDNPNKILAVRALDKDNKYLKKSDISHVITNNATGAKSIILNYEGDVNSIEINYATETQTKKYPLLLRLQMEKLKFSNEKKPDTPATGDKKPE